MVQGVEAQRSAIRAGHKLVRRESLDASSKYFVQGGVRAMRQIFEGTEESMHTETSQGTFFQYLMLLMLNDLHLL